MCCGTYLKRKTNGIFRLYSRIIVTGGHGTSCIMMSGHTSGLIIAGEKYDGLPSGRRNI